MVSTVNNYYKWQSNQNESFSSSYVLYGNHFESASNSWITVMNNSVAPAIIHQLIWISNHYE